MNIDQVYGLAQQIAVGVLGLGVIVQAVRAKLKGGKEDNPKTGPVKLPGDALAKDHPDPVVRRLETMLAGVGRQLDEQQKRLDAADKREGLMRKDMETVRKEARENGELVYWLRRIVRRMVDAWPAGGEAPPLSPHEWEIVGVDEDTTPRSEFNYRTEDYG